VVEALNQLSCDHSIMWWKFPIAQPRYSNHIRVQRVSRVPSTTLDVSLHIVTSQWMMGFAKLTENDLPGSQFITSGVDMC